MNIHTRSRFISIFLMLSMLLMFAPGAAAEGEYGYISSRGARVFLNENLSGASGALRMYSLLDVISVSGGVAQIRWRSYTGYIDADYITVLGDGYEAEFRRTSRVFEYPSSSARSARVGSGTDVNVLAIAGNAAIIERNGALAYALTRDLAEKNAVQEPADEIVKCDFEACIAADSLSVYSSASTNSVFLGALTGGEVFRVTAYNSTWAYITYDGRSGFALKSGIKKYEAPAPEPDKTDDMFAGVVYDEFSAKVTADKLSVYKAEPGKSDKLTELKQGDVVGVTAYTTSWARVTVSGASGFCEISGLVKYTPPKYTEDSIFDSDKSNEDKLYLYFTEIAGLSPAAACGILANVKKECNFNPASENSLGAFGICQWLKGRKANLLAYCEELGLESTSLRAQAKFCVKEMKDKYPKVYSYMTGVQNTAEGAYDAAYYFCYYYEIPGNRAASSVARGNLAKDTYWVRYVK